MAGKFAIKESNTEKFNFNLKDRKRADSFIDRNLQTKQEAEKSAESVRKNASDENHYERKTAKNDEACFVLKAGNCEPLGRNETYSSKSAMENGIESVKKNAVDATVSDVFKD